MLLLVSLEMLSTAVMVLLWNSRKICVNQCAPTLSRVPYLPNCLLVRPQVWSWGSGKHGCLGLGDLESRWYPDRIPFFAESQPARVETISAGSWHVMCLSHKQEVYTWGRNNWGQASRCWHVYRSVLYEPILTTAHTLCLGLSIVFSNAS